MNFVGPRHPNWQDSEDIAYGPGWEEARECALERDEYCGQIWGASRGELGQNPDVHHIRPVRWFVNSDENTRQDAHSLENLISLCRACHRKVETEEIDNSLLQDTDNHT
jgi:5-methylcytosine-specific restriction endonuclease McrA